MKKRTTNIFKLVMISGAMLLLITRCAKLEQVPMDFVGPDNFYKTEGQILASFASAQDRLFTAWGVYHSTLDPLIRWDDQRYGGDLINTSDVGENFWFGHYQAINDINPAIKALNNDVLGVNATQEVKDQLMAQARFLRAFNYLSLVRFYGDVPLLIETTNPVTDKISRTPIKDVYALIESDLLYAIANLPESWPAALHGRPTSDVAKGLLARTYITMATAPLNETANFVKARDMAKQVMDEGRYSLINDVDQVFALENGWGPEFMWSFNVSSDDLTSPQIYTPETMNNGWGTPIDLVFGTTFPDQPRRDAYLIMEDYDGNPWTTFWFQTPGIRKFIYDTQEHMNALQSYQNYPILRYADILLLFAEAENMINNGPTQAACDAVNQIIDRANGYVVNPADPLVTTSMTKDAFDAAVMRERSWELCFENAERWHDIVRKRILLEVTIPAYKQNFSEDDYLFPIPSDDLLLNPLLIQNPGWPLPQGTSK